MRESLLSPLPALSILSLVLLLLIPATATAQSGSDARVTMSPEVAGPGDTVLVSGLDFPRDMTVVVQLTTAEGPVTLATVATAPDGSFRERVALPDGVPEGTWTVSARSSDGLAMAGHQFLAGDAPPAAAGTEMTTEASAGTSNSTSDNMVLVLMGLLLGAIATGALFAYRLVKEEGPQPGMGSGDDLIWGSGSAAAEPEMTATNEPHWKATSDETDEDTEEQLPTGAHEAPTSA